jgi:hypothetical protein
MIQNHEVMFNQQQAHKLEKLQSSNQDLQTQLQQTEGQLLETQEKLRIE